MRNFKKIVKEIQIASYSMYDIEGKSIQGFIDTLQSTLIEFPNAQFELQYNNNYDDDSPPDLGIVVRSPETDEEFEKRKLRELAHEKAGDLKKKVNANKKAAKEKMKAELLFKAELEELKRLQEKYKEVEVK